VNIVTDRSKKERSSLFIPIYYSFISRGRTLKMLFGLYFLYTACLPMLFIELVYLHQNGLNQYISKIFPEHLAIYISLYFLFFLVYEIGYIYNDVISEKKEGVNTGRLHSSISDGLVYSSLAFRALLLLSAFGLLWLFYEWEHLYHFIAYNAVLLIAYHVHNSIPKPYRLVTIFYLRIYRVTYPVFFFLCAKGPLAYPIISYAVVLSAYNVLTYLGVNYEEFGLSESNIFSKYYHNCKTRTVFFITNIIILNCFGTILLSTGTKMLLGFVAFSSVYFLIQHAILRNSLMSTVKKASIREKDN